ncbi:hypothetical protein LINPERPRIM_LOCUS35102 [Linum perenne]
MMINDVNLQPRGIQFPSQLRSRLQSDGNHLKKADFNYSDLPSRSSELRLHQGNHSHITLEVQVFDLLRPSLVKPLMAVRKTALLSAQSGAGHLVHLIGNLKPADDATTAAAAVLIPDAGISKRQSVDLEKESVDEKEKHQKLVEGDDVLVEKKSVDKKKRKSKRKGQSEENAVKDNSEENAGNAVKVNSEDATVKDNSENVINEGDVVEVSEKKKSKRPKHLRPVKSEKTDV